MKSLQLLRKPIQLNFVVRIFYEKSKSILKNIGFFQKMKLVRKIHYSSISLLIHFNHQIAQLKSFPFLFIEWKNVENWRSYSKINVLLLKKTPCIITKHLLVKFGSYTEQLIDFEISRDKDGFPKNTIGHLGLNRGSIWFQWYEARPRKSGS